MLFILLILILPRPVAAQFEGFKNFNVKDGLPGSELYGVLQDSKGYMWFIGDQGVSRFNGYTFKNYSTENGLPDNTVVGIYEDKKQRIWFRSLTGRLSYYKNDSIYNVGCNNSLEKLFKLFINSSIYVDEGDTIWLGATLNIIIKINPGWKTNDLQKIPLPPGSYFYTVGREGLIFGGGDGTAHEEVITGYTGNLKKICTLHTGIFKKKHEVRRYTLIRLENGTYLAALGKTLINFGNCTILHRKIMNGSVIDLLQDADHSIIVCTLKGVAIFRDQNLETATYLSQLQNKIITGACTDRENETWFTSEGHGVYYIPHKNFKYYTAENGISDSKISCMRYYRGTSVIAGFMDGTVSVLNQDSITNYYMPENRLVKQVSRIAGINNCNNHTYINNAEKTCMFTGRSLKLIPELESTATRKIIESKKDHKLWVLKFASLFKYDPQRSFSVISGIDLKDRVHDIYEDSNGLLWLCSINGVCTYDGKTIKTPGPADSLLRYRAVDITEDLQKNIWIATRGGGVIIKKGNRLIQLTEAKGLAGNMCKSLLADSNIMWVGTNKGLSKIKLLSDGSYSIENMYSKDGLLTNETGSIIKCGSCIWIAHNNGITVFDPATLNAGKYIPPVYITAFSANDKAYPLYTTHTFAFNQNHIAIRYEGLSYKNAGNVEYKYKIKGVDPDWVHTFYTSVKYQNLPAGNYTFEVYAKSNDGVWSNVPAAIRFNIMPAWWRTWWFITLCLVICIVVIMALFKARLYRVRKTESEKELLRHRISVIELQALRSQMNPHFVFNAINSVQYFITDNDPESSQLYLEKFASLIRYVLDNSKLAPIPLKTEIDALRIYMELEALRFKFDYIINIENKIPIDDIYIPSMLIQPYVENSIWHGLMHKKEKGEINVTFIVSATHLKCIIEDNGIGRKRSAEIALSSGKIETHKSVGMSITKERLDIINKVNQSHLTVTVTDKINTAGESTGTKVEINIPF